MDALEDLQSALRAQVRGRRPEDPEAAARAAQERLARSELMLAPRLVGLYRALPTEVPTHLLAGSLLARGIELCWPRVVPGQAMLEFRRSGSSWARGALRVEEPTGEPVPLALVDVLVVPAVAVDEQGRRLGRGKGHYDATLSGFAGRSVALVYDAQLVPEVPVGDHDRAVDAVCTESRLIVVKA
jgi:5-formyltetrahydrofolate cyclo-ligase